MMRTKKVIIQICLICACMLLQAHIILPHLHHDGIVCITKEGGTACIDCHSEKDSHHTKTHCSDTLDECDIKQIVIRESDSDEDLNGYHLSDLFSSYYLMTSFCCLFLEFPDSISDKEQTPYINTYTSSFSGSIKSLRAPPFFLG